MDSAPSPPTDARPAQPRRTARAPRAPESVARDEARPAGGSGREPSEGKTALPKTRAPRAPTVRSESSLGKPRRWDVRMIISIPAIVTLLAISMGVVYYAISLDLVSQIDALAQQMEDPGGAPVSSADLHGVASDLLAKVLTVLLAFTVLGLLSGLGLVWTILRPIRLVADAVASIARGEIRQSVDIRGGAFEIDQLGKSFNSMVDFINSMIEKRDTFLSEGIETGLSVQQATGLPVWATLSLITSW